MSTFLLRMCTAVLSARVEFYRQIIDNKQV